MRPAGGLRTVVAAQFLGALADGALLVVALQALAERHAPGWQAPALRVVFYGCYVLLAVFSGVVADAFAKRDVLVATGLVKVAGCAMLLCGVHPLAAYAFVGLGAVSHMPARYGILGELVPPDGLVHANAWMEVATMAAGLVGVALGGALVQPGGLPFSPQGTARAAALWLLVPYCVAVLCCVCLPRWPAVAPGALRSTGRLPRQFARVTRSLLRDGPARNALAMTTTLWSVAAVLQFALLRWAGERLGLPLSRAVLLQLAVAVGMIAGAAAAGRWATLARPHASSLAGVSAGVVLMALAVVHTLAFAVVLLVGVGVLAGLVLVPMNSVVQARGTQARRPGEWLGAQHFAENAGSLLLLGAYAAAVSHAVTTAEVVLLLGACVALTSLATRRAAGRATGAAWSRT